MIRYISTTIDETDTDDKRGYFVLCVQYYYGKGSGYMNLVCKIKNIWCCKGIINYLKKKISLASNWQ